MEADLHGRNSQERTEVPLRRLSFGSTHSTVELIGEGEHGSEFELLTFRWQGCGGGSSGAVTKGRSQRLAVTLEDAKFLGSRETLSLEKVGVATTIGQVRSAIASPRWWRSVHRFVAASC
eukprot:SAG11_NODE_11_length_27870_cov_16.327428_10_plen_120_part_00